MTQFIRGSLPPKTLFRRVSPPLTEVDPAIIETLTGFSANQQQGCEWYKGLTRKDRSNVDRHIMHMSRESDMGHLYLAFDIVSKLLSQSIPLTKKLISAVAQDIQASRYAVNQVKREADAWLRQINCESHDGKLFTTRHGR